MTLLKSISSCACGLSCLSNVQKPVNLQFVRFRKPRWVPKAPSKIYKVREPTPIDPVEYQKLKVWTDHYNTERKSLQRFLVNYHKETELRRKIEAAERPFEERFAQMVKTNDLWNEQTSMLKNIDWENKMKIDALRRQKIAEREAREREETRKAAETRVLHEKEVSGTFIKPENLEEEVEKVLNMRSDYDFALHVDGTTTKDEKPSVEAPKTNS